jgi:hypothetical protein
MPVIFRPPNLWWWYDARDYWHSAAKGLPSNRVVKAQTHGYYGLDDEYWEIVNAAGGYMIMHPVKIADLGPEHGLTVSHTYQRTDQYWPHVAFDDDAAATIFKLTHL